MTTWAIEAENLVKKFPQRGNPAVQDNGKKEKNKTPKD